MSFNQDRAFDLLKRLAFTRVSGTPEELRAAHILMDEIRSFGLEPELEAFTVPDAVNVSASLEVLAPYQATYNVTAYKCCLNTPDEGMEAELVYVEEASDAALVNVRGKVVLINGMLRLPIYKKLMEKGVAGIITMSGTLFGRPEDSELPTRKIRATLSPFGLCPAIMMTTRDAFEMVVKGASRVRMTVHTESAELTSHNVMVTIPGSAYPEEIISFGAHYDSVEYSTGAYDNAAGSVVLMELLRWYAGHPPVRTLRFNWYGAEEIGLEGSKAFVRMHADELPRHLFMFNLDVGGPVLGQDIAKVCGDMAIVHALDAFMKVQGHTTNVAQGTQSSDSMPFAEQGIPAINFIRGAAPGAAVMHDRNDVIDHLSAAALAKTGVPMLDFVSRVTEAVVFPFERRMPEEMVTAVEKYFFKKELADVK